MSLAASQVSEDDQPAWVTQIFDAGYIGAAAFFSWGR